MPQRNQPLAQFAIVINFAVENDSDVFRFVPRGLMTAGQVDDAQAPHAERKSRCSRIVDEKSVFVRTAMAQRRIHGAHLSLGVRTRIRECGAADAAHALFDLRCGQKRRCCAQKMLAKMKAGNLQPVVRIPGENEPQHQQ